MEQNEQVKSQVSSFMDGEVSQQEVAFLCKRISNDEVLRRKWQEYHLISDAMKQQLPAQPMVDISARVRDALQDEPVLGELKVASSGFGRRITGMAVAASVAVFGVVGVMTMATQQNELQPQNLAQTDSAVVSGAVVADSSTTTAAAANRAPDPRLNKYLVDHSEYAVSASVHGVLPYARIVGQQKQEQK